VSRGASAKFAALDVSFGVRLAEGSIPGPIDEWSSTVSVEKDRHGLLAERRDLAVTFVPLGTRMLALDLVEVHSASHRLSADNPVAAMVKQLEQLDPPPTSGNDAFRRLNGRRSVIQSAYKMWLDQDPRSGTRGTTLKSGYRGTASTPVPGTGTHAGTAQAAVIPLHQDDAS
jgi:hypothetical protein